MREQVTVGQGAWRALMTHPREAAAIALEQGALRLAALLPVLLHAWAFPALPAWPFWFAALLLYMLLVIPLRFRGGEMLRYLSSPKHQKPQGSKPYQRWLKMGLARWSLGLLWGLPFLVCAGYFVYGWNHMAYTTMLQPLMAVARVLGGGSEANGLPLAGAGLALLLFLFVYGWWRGMPVEYLPVRHLSVKKAGFFWKRARKMGRARLIKNAGMNFLLSLPAAIGFGAVLLPYIRSKMPATSNLQLMATAVVRLLRAPLPAAQWMRLIPVFLLLYLPFCLLRKMRNAVLVRRLTKECNDLGGDHAAG